MLFSNFFVRKKYKKYSFEIVFRCLSYFEIGTRIFLRKKSV